MCLPVSYTPHFRINYYLYQAFKKVEIFPNGIDEKKITVTPKPVRDNTKTKQHNKRIIYHDQVGTMLPRDARITQLVPQ